MKRPANNENPFGKTMKKLLFLALFAGLFTSSCDDLFDKGDVEGTYDGPTVVAFYPLQKTVRTSSSSSTSVQVQLIGPQRSSDLSVAYQVGSSSTAVSGTHYNLNVSPVTISGNTSTADITIELIDGVLQAGQEVALILELQGSADVPASENLKQSVIYIRP